MKDQFKIKGLSVLLLLGVVWFASSACFPVYAPPTPVNPNCPAGAPPDDPCYQRP